MFSSPFNETKVYTVPEDCDIVFVADFFKEDLIGGAELTTEALIESSPFKVHKIHSKDVSLKTLESGHSKFWIFGNFAGLNLQLVPSIVANMKYSILEYDYKFCKYRSPEKHQSIEMKACDCNQSMHGKMISAFMHGAKCLWFMSEGQEKLYQKYFPFLMQKDSTVLSSVFDNNFFLTLKILRERYENTERKGWLVLGSTSWIKGSDDAEQYCKDNGLEYQVILGWPYERVLEEMAQAEGFVYLPKGNDTCPRMVIEAKLLGCKLHVNDYVQHAKEEWFNTENSVDTESYLYAARERFWNAIKYYAEYQPTISAYTTTMDCIKHGYPWKECINSMLGFADEVVVMDGGSTDGTYEELTDWATDDRRLKVFRNLRDWNHPRFAVYDGAQKAAARKMCTMDYCWQQDADEVVEPHDYEKIKTIARNFPMNTALISLPVVEYWGDTGKVRMDVNPWKWRFSRNLPHITHGIPHQFRKFDNDGLLYAAMGTDGCDYINEDTYDIIKHGSFYTEDAHRLRLAALNGDHEAYEHYARWFGNAVGNLPSVIHYSWYDIGRKIRTYRDYWSSHWQSLYDIEQEDTAENNMFFQRPWSEVTEEDIDSLALRLRDEMGGWVFHSPVDFNAQVPCLYLKESGDNK